MIYAGFGRRLAAYLLDGLILAVPFYFLLTNIGGESPKDSEGSAKALMVLFFLITWPLMISSSWETTPGKFLLGMKVIRSDGSRLSFGRAFGRTCATIISAMIFYVGYMFSAEFLWCSI